MDSCLIDGSFQDLMDGKTVALRCDPIDVYFTPSGRIEFASSKAEKDGLNPVPDTFIVNRNSDEFFLLSSAVPQYTHTQFQEVYGDIPDEVWINPVDAESCHVMENDEVYLITEQGETMVTVVVTNRVPEGVLWAPHEFTDQNGQSHNSITNSVTQRIGGGNMFNSTIVKIKKK